MEGEGEIIKGEIVASETGDQPTPSQASGQDQDERPLPSGTPVDEHAPALVSLENFLAQELLIAGCPPLEIPHAVEALRQQYPEQDFSRVRDVHEWVREHPVDPTVAAPFVSRLTE